MPRKFFKVPLFYQSPIISTIKGMRQREDPRKRDLSPALLDLGTVRFHIARHFGFCYGVENAVQIAYQAIEENPGQRLFMLSEMIHNPHVNEDLQQRGMRFLRTTQGEQLIPFDELRAGDIVVIPAFGASLEIQEDLVQRGIKIESYDTTCPFIEKVWRRSRQLSEKNYSIIVHGKRYHEETRATFSRVRRLAPTVVVRDIDETRILCQFIQEKASPSSFSEHFEGCYSEGFDPARDLQRVGVVNQTTMLASETKAIANLLRETLIARHGEENIGFHFADTNDTLCYATHENQQSAFGLIDENPDMIFIVGGYNSSNTSHLVELCQQAVPTYFVKDAEDISSPARLRHFDYATKMMQPVDNWLPEHRPIDVGLTAGASCPDVLLDQVIRRVAALVPGAQPIEEVLATFDVEVPAHRLAPS